MDKRITIDYGILTEDYYFADYCKIDSGAKIYANCDGELWIVIYQTASMAFNSVTSEIEPCFKKSGSFKVSQDLFLKSVMRINSGEIIRSFDEMFPEDDMETIVPDLNAEEKFRINQILINAVLIREIDALAKKHGDKFCLVNQITQCSINDNGENYRYSVNVTTACADSELYNFWKRIIDEKQIEQGYGIISVKDFCNLYLRKIIG